MGRDHTIYATETGYVKYYKDPERHPKRQYIGVVFERHQTLPLPRNSPRRRRLGMLATKMEVAPVAAPAATAEQLAADAEALARVKITKQEIAERSRRLKPGYMYRESNWEIGQAADRTKNNIRAFKPGDRWLAWKKKTIARARSAEKRRLGAKKKKQKR
jgi:large subunit ribosomal protein L27